jgi:hypothetical protein
MLLMWGCLIAVAITFPLVFGWLHFRPVRGDLSLYEAVAFGFPAFRFPHDSLIAFFLFHGLARVARDLACLGSCTPRVFLRYPWARHHGQLMNVHEYLTTTGRSIDNPS